MLGIDIKGTPNVFCSGTFLDLEFRFRVEIPIVSVDGVDEDTEADRKVHLFQTLLLAGFDGGGIALSPVTVAKTWPPLTPPSIPPSSSFIFIPFTLTNEGFVSLFGVSSGVPGSE